jgi:hypothetical protein
MPSEKQYFVVELTEQLAEHRDLPPDEVRPMAVELVSEAVDLRPDPAAIGSGYDLVHESNGDVVSRKPSNVDVQIDFETGLLVLSELSAFASGDPVAVGSALAGLSAIVVGEGTITLSEESACVYAIAAEHWELGSPFAQAALIETVVDETTDRDEIESLSPAAIKDALDELETVGCLSRRSDNEATRVVLEERCTEYWD